MGNEDFSIFLLRAKSLRHKVDKVAERKKTKEAFVKLCTFVLILTLAHTEFFFCAM